MPRSYFSFILGNFLLSQIDIGLFVRDTKHIEELRLCKSGEPATQFGFAFAQKMKYESEKRDCVEMMFPYCVVVVDVKMCDARPVMYA